MKKVTLSFLLLFSFANIFAQNIDLEKEKEALIAADKAWAEATKSSQMETSWSFWDDNAMLLVATDYFVTGKEEIKNFTTRARTDPNFSIDWQVKGVNVSPSADMGYTYGVGTVTRSGENGEIMKSSSPYLVVWTKNEEGKWKVIIEN